MRNEHYRGGAETPAKLRKMKRELDDIRLCFEVAAEQDAEVMAEIEADAR